MKKMSCPSDCQDKHAATREMMAETRKDLTYIREKLDENTLQHVELMNSFKKVSEEKADKTEVNDLKGKFWAAVLGVISLLLTIIFMLLNR